MRPSAVHRPNSAANSNIRLEGEGYQCSPRKLYPLRPPPQHIHPNKPPELWINEVGVAESHQGRGIGKAIMNEMLNLGKALGCVNAWVLTDKNNTAANGLYKSVGGNFSDEETVLYEFRINEE